MARLLSVNVGMPQDIQWSGRTVHTGVWKQSVSGRRMVRRLNIDGDGQGDLVGHGGEQRAVLVYQIDSYRYWEQELGRSRFAYGQFGDNFTVEGLPDDEVCIGDQYRIGDAVFEVSQPRVTCYRVGIRMGEPRMAALLVAHHRPGFYLRVLHEGEVGAGDEIVKVADGPERLTVAETDALLYLPDHELAVLERALRIPALSVGWQTSFRALAEERQDGGAAGNAGLALDIGPAPAWPGFRTMRVSSVQQESAGVFSLHLDHVGDEPVHPAAPGQFVTLRLPVGAEQPQVLRSYSLSGAPSSPGYRISVKREPHGVAGEFLHDHVHSGDMVQVAAPRGGFILRSGTRPVVLLSAGVGATPVLAMLHAQADEDATRSVWWVYGARSSAEHPFRQEVEDLLHDLPASRRLVAYSQPLATDRLGADFDLQGRLSTEALLSNGVPLDADFYLCGPEGFMHDLGAGLAERGVAHSRIRREVFGPGSATTPGVIRARGDRVRQPHPPEVGAGEGPEVSFARSGLTVDWDERYASLLELAEACDVTVRWACRTGVCHTCISSLLAGEVAYQPEPLDPPGPDDALICCSRPRSDVVLDL